MLDVFIRTSRSGEDGLRRNRLDGRVGEPESGLMHRYSRAGRRPDPPDGEVLFRLWEYDVRSGARSGGLRGERRAFRKPARGAGGYARTHRPRRLEQFATVPCAESCAHSTASDDFPRASVRTVLPSAASHRRAAESVVMVALVRDRRINDALSVPPQDALLKPGDWFPHLPRVGSDLVSRSASTRAGTCAEATRSLPVSR